MCCHISPIMSYYPTELCPLPSTETRYVNNSLGPTAHIVHRSFRYTITRSGTWLTIPFPYFIIHYVGFDIMMNPHPLRRYPHDPSILISKDVLGMRMVLKGSVFQTF